MKFAVRRDSKKAQIGDLIEIQTPRGLGYVQYTHHGGSHGELVRVLPGLYDDRPSDLVQLVNSKEAYFAFYLLNEALRAGDVNVVANLPIPEQWRNSYPMMRQSVVVDQNGHTTRWRIVSASNKLTLRELQGTCLVDVLSHEQMNLSLFQMSPHPAMVEKLVSGWTPMQAEEFTFRKSDAKVETSTGNSQPAQGPSMLHFLYFQDEQGSRKAGDRLREDGFVVEERGAETGRDWLVLASRDMPTTPQLAKSSATSWKI